MGWQHRARERGDTCTHHPALVLAAKNSRKYRSDENNKIKKLTVEKLRFNPLLHSSAGIEYYCHTMKPKKIIHNFHFRKSSFRLSLIIMEASNLFGPLKILTKSFCLKGCSLEATLVVYISIYTYVLSSQFRIYIGRSQWNFSSVCQNSDATLAPHCLEFLHGDFLKWKIKHFSTKCFWFTFPWILSLAWQKHSSSSNYVEKGALNCRQQNSNLCQLAEKTIILIYIRSHL